MQYSNKKIFLSICWLITIITVCLGIFHGLSNIYFQEQNTFIIFLLYHFFSFSKQNLFLLLILFPLLIFKPRSKINNILGFCIMTNFFLNSLCFRSFIRDWNIIYTSQNFIFYNVIIYFLEYIILPILFMIIFFRNPHFRKVPYYGILVAFGTILFYFIIKLSVNLFLHKPCFEIFINPHHQKHFIISYLKILIAFILLNSVFLFYQNYERITWFWKYSGLIVLSFIISTIPLQYQDWIHAKQVILKYFNMGAGIFPETQELSEHFKNVSNDNLKGSTNTHKILELGAGSGNVTQYLIDKFGIENIISIELDDVLCKTLKDRFSGLKVIHGNAANFEKLLEENKFKIEQIKGIVSTLPVSIFNDTDFKQLTNSITKIVRQNKIKYMCYRFKLFENSTRIIPLLKVTSNFIFISAMIMPISVYTYSCDN